jgi:outer membrane protein TolC
MVNTIASVIINYYGVVRQKQQLTAILEQKSISEERVKLAEKKLQVGTGGKPELLQAKVDLNSIRTLEIQQETTITQLKEQLNGLVGLALPSNYDVTDTIIIDLSIKQSEIEQDIENKNFSLIAAKQNMSIAGLSLRERKAERIPVVNFTAAYNYSRIDNIQLINPFSSLINQSNGYNYGLSLSIPILNGFSVTRSIQQARINDDRQKISYELQKLQIDIGVRNAFINYENAIKILVLEEENILLAKENLNIALEGFKRGVTTFIELRTAQQSLAEAYNRLINARYISKLAETELLRLNGSLLR